MISQSRISIGTTGGTGTPRLDLEIFDSDISEPYHSGKGGKRQVENREFIAWDGEGITYDGETQQSYVLFGNSKGYEISAKSLTTLECLELMIQTERDHPLGIHVGFAFSYDAEMILRDLPVETLTSLYRYGRVRWQGYSIEFRRGKWFSVSLHNKVENTVCKIWDVFSFFSTTFVKALEEYLGRDEETAFIEAGKARRARLDYRDLDAEIRPYWQAELRTMVRLMVTLRDRLYGAGLRITNWHGPGAIATYAMTQRGVKKTMSTIPSEVAKASRFAYAGGRFELFKIGHSVDPVYAYDIRSAYPSAIRHLPNLSTGDWRYEESPASVEQFGMYHIRFAHPELFTTRPMPFPFRDVRSAVHFPNVVEGWYWSPEAKIAEYLGKDAEILGAWVYEDSGERPFYWIEEIYEQRAQWKREGNPSQIALKLLMNSMYGKFAQRVGFKGKNAPTWHQLEWAGWVTSYTRAKLFRAMLEAYQTDSLIAVETDGIFTSQPLNQLDIGPGLGQWEMDTYDEMVYLQSGFYFKREGDQWASKARGFDSGSVTLDNALHALRLWSPDSDSGAIGRITGQQTRFRTMGQYLRMREPDRERRRWITDTRELSLGTDGKRIHRPFACQACANGISPADTMHDMSVALPVGGHTFPHELPWIDDQYTRQKLKESIGVYDGANPFRSIDDGEPLI
jgi:hypothetical protein